MILQPFYLNDDAGQEVIVRFEEIISIGRKVQEQRNIVYVYIDDTHYVIQKKDIVDQFESWLKECKEIIRCFFEAQSRPQGAFTTDGNLKFEKKTK